MKKTIVFLLLSLIGILGPGCEKDPPAEPTEPAATSGKTNAQGMSTLTLGPYQLQTTVKDQNNAPVAQIIVEAYLLDDMIVTVASDSIAGRYYPSFEVVNLRDIRKYSHAQYISPEIAPIIILKIVIKLTIVTYKAIEIVEDIEIIRNNGGIESICYRVDLSDFLSIASRTLGLGIKKRGLLVNVSRTAASKLGLGSDAKTIAVSADALELGVDGFTKVLSDLFHLLDQDRLLVCFNIQRGTGKKLPIISIEDVELNRTFAYKFILTWGENPRDLDSHLWTPTIGGRTHHVHFRSKGSLTSSPFAQLDVDDTSSYGPESITIQTLHPGTYRFAVYHFAGTGTITTSGARVKVFRREGLVGEYAVPRVTSTANDWWYLGDIDGSTGAFTLRNQIVTSQPRATGVSTPMQKQ